VPFDVLVYVLSQFSNVVFDAFSFFFFHISLYSKIIVLFCLTVCA
jgi:hypothetical protein